MQDLCLFLCFCYLESESHGRGTDSSRGNVKVGKMEIFLLPPFPIYTAGVHGAQPAKIFPEGLIGSHCWAAAPALPVNNFCLNFCRVGAGGISQTGVCLAQV